jgi:hypothetical protein
MLRRGAQEHAEASNQHQEQSARSKLVLAIQYVFQKVEHLLSRSA